MKVHKAKDQEEDAVLGLHVAERKGCEGCLHNEEPDLGQEVSLLVGC